MDEVEVDYLMRSFNDARVVQGVRREVFAYLGLGSPGTLQTLVSSNALRNGCHTRMRKLKFGLYERPESDLNRRLITNKKAVLSLFKTISKEHTTVFHVSRNDDLQELIDKFNNFDIVVHLGVHLGVTIRIFSLRGLIVLHSLKCLGPKCLQKTRRKNFEKAWFHIIK